MAGYCSVGHIYQLCLHLSLKLIIKSGRLLKLSVCESMCVCVCVCMLACKYVRMYACMLVFLYPCEQNFISQLQKQPVYKK